MNYGTFRRRTRDAAFAGIVALLLTTIGCGCGTPHGAAASTAPTGIRLLDPDTLSVNGRPTAIEKSVSRIRAAGYTTDTSLRIEVPEGTPHASLAKVTRTLAAGGYRRIIFAAPRQAEAFTRPTP